jgi:hypothetical protein
MKALSLYKRVAFDGRLPSWNARILRLELGAGWLLRPQGTERFIAVNRDMSWKYNRQVCLSIWRLRIGFKWHRQPADEPI